MLRFHLYGRRQCDGIDVTALAEMLPGYSASDLKVLVDEAARRARKARRPISEDDLRTAARELVSRFRHRARRAALSRLRTARRQVLQLQSGQRHRLRSAHRYRR
jgi:ATP-dependent 26S proteasome regulatory subunit